jgi:hypothetical protein
MNSLACMIEEHPIVESDGATLVVGSTYVASIEAGTRKH